MHPFTSIPLPELVGLLAWWTVMLAAVVSALRRLRRRSRPGRPHRRRTRVLLLVLRGRRSADVGELPLDAGVVDESTEAHDLGTCGCAGGDLRPAVRTGPEDPVGVDGTASSVACTDGVRRLAGDALVPLCQYVDFRRRLELAAAGLEVALRELPADRWRIEPYPLTGERRNTFVVIGVTGIFVISATYAPGHWDDVTTVHKLARKIQALVPGYTGEVHAAICYPFTMTSARIWHRADEHGDWIGAWVTGGNSVIEWLAHFGPEHGLGAADLARFDALATPNWLNCAIPAGPSWPLSQGPAASDGQE